MVIRARVHSQAEPVADPAAAPITIRRRRQALLGGFLLAIAAALCIAVPLRGPLFDTSAAVPDLSVPDRAPGPLLVPGEPPGSEQRAQEVRQAQFDALNQVEQTRARLQELTEATATVATHTDVLVGQIRLNEQLDKSLARADAARQAAIAEAEKTRAEMARKLGAATDAAAQSRADLAGLHKELEAIATSLRPRRALARRRSGRARR